MYKEMRVRFCKVDNAVYFSHLDLNRAVMRALRRSGVPYWSKGGFNPHPYCVFAMPLSLGFESEGELFDFRVLNEGEFDLEALKKAFPDCLKIMDVYEPQNQFKEIAYADYTVILKTDVDAEAIQTAFAKPLTVLKKTKRSEKEVEIGEFIRSITAEDCAEGVKLSVTLAAGNEKNLSPNYLAEGLKNAGIAAELHYVKRLCFRTADGNEIR